MSSNNYLFIDGSYLDKVIENFSQKFLSGKRPELLYGNLTQGHIRTFYYDCPLEKKNNQTEEQFQELVKYQEKKFRQIRSTVGTHLYTGLMRGQGKKQRQKAVDVKIAVDMFTHAIRGNMSHATLLSGDLDFLPLVEALVQEGIYITIYCERSSASTDLVYAADARYFFDPSVILDWLVPLQKKAFDFPKKLGIGQWLPEENLCRDGTSQDEFTVKLFRIKNKYTLIYQQNPDSSLIQVNSADESLLLKSFEYEFGEIKWNNS